MSGARVPFDYAEAYFRTPETHRRTEIARKSQNPQRRVGLVQNLVWQFQFQVPHVFYFSGLGLVQCNIEL